MSEATHDHSDGTGRQEPNPLRWDLLEDENERTRLPRRRWVLGVAALAPWIVAGAVVVRSLSAPVPAEVTPSAAGSASAHGDLGGAAPVHEGRSEGRSGGRSVDTGGAPNEMDEGYVTVLEPGGRVVPDVGDAAALALIAGRHWLGDLGAGLELGLGRAGTGSYVEHLAVESFDMPGAGSVVVSLVAVLLDVGEDTYTGARVVRIAVPVLLDGDGARLAGDPWWLSPPDLTVADLAWSPIEDPGELLQAAEALTAAGFTEVDVHALSSSASWPHRVEVSAVAPGATSAATQTVWLRRHLDGFVVAGALPSRGYTDPATPREDPTPAHEDHP